MNVSFQTGSLRYCVGVSHRRYFIEPERTVISISTMDELVDYMEPHETGGILAHAFYRIVDLHGQDMRQVCSLQTLYDSGVSVVLQVQQTLYDSVVSVFPTRTGDVV